MHAMMFGLKRGYYGALRYARRVMKGFGVGVTPARFDLLYALRQQGWHLQSELRRILGVAGPTVSRMLKSLEGLGLVKREVAPHDGREKVVSFTDAGEKAFDRVAEAVMGTGCAEVAMARAAMGDARAAMGDARAAMGDARAAMGDARAAMGDATTKGWTFRRGLLAVENAEEMLVRVRRGFGDGAQLLYTRCPYVMGWDTGRKTACELYDASVVDPPMCDVVEVPPPWPGKGETYQETYEEPRSNEVTFGKIVARPWIESGKWRWKKPRTEPGSPDYF